jgi:uncharacterized membrane protein
MHRHASLEHEMFHVAHENSDFQVHKMTTLMYTHLIETKRTFLIHMHLASYAHRLDNTIVYIVYAFTLCFLYNERTS